MAQVGRGEFDELLERGGSGAGSEVDGAVFMKQPATTKDDERKYRERAVIDAAKKWRRSKSNIDAALLDMAVTELVLFETTHKESASA